MDDPADESLNIEKRGDDRDSIFQSEPVEDSGATFEALTSAIPSPVLVVDDCGDITHANEPFQSQFGYDPVALAGESITSFCPTLSISDIVEYSGVDRNDEYLSTLAMCGDGTHSRLELDVGAVSLGGETRYVTVMHDVTAHYEKNETFEKFERIFQTIDDGVYVLDDSFNITMINDAVISMTGYSREELVGANAMKLASEETIQKASVMSEALMSSEMDAAMITTEIETADGETIPIETRFSTYQFADGSYGQVGVFRDISERIWYEQMLTALHASTRELLHAESKSDVADHIVDTATDVLDLSAAVIYLFDSDANVLRPMATSLAVDQSVTDLPPVNPGEGTPWDVFVDNRQEVNESGEPIELSPGVDMPAENGIFLPLDDHGVFFVAMDDEDQADPSTLELIDLLAASAESGLVRVDREEELRVQDRALREQNEQLRRLKRMNEIIRRIDQALVDADSREEIETAVCDRLVDSSSFAAAWIGQQESGQLVPQAWAGDMAGYIDAVDLSVEAGGSSPSVRAARTGELVVESDVAADLHSEQWRTEAITRDFQSVISVPLGSDDVSYGVLTVYSTEQAEFDESMQSVFTELAETISNALRVIETKQWLSADTVIELDLEISDPDDPLARLAAEIEGSVTLDGIVPRESADCAFVQVKESTRDAVESAAEKITGITAIRAIDDEETQLFEISLTAQTIAMDIVDQGARIRSFRIDDRIAATVELSPSASVREFINALKASHGETELLARRDRAEPLCNEGGFRAALSNRLTERQQQILQTAYLSGFFDWPRTTTGEGIAESFDVSQPTINRHLRISLRKCLELLYDEG